MEDLTIQAKAKYNGSVVQCIIFSAQGISAQSDNVTLSVQGIYNIGIKVFFLLLMVFYTSGLLSVIGDLFIAESTSSLTIS